MSTTEQVKQPDTAIVHAPPKEIADVLKPAPQAGKLTRIAAFTPTNLTEAIALSKLIANSDLAPKEYKGKPANVLIAMQMGAELGVAPMQALQNIAVINGRASVWGDLALAIVQTHPAYEYHKEWIEGQGDTRAAHCQVKRKGHELHTASFSVAMAKTAKLWQKRGYNGQDTPWITNPDRMLAMRARGFALRDKFADALRGLILAEEAIDITPDLSDAKKKREEATLDVGATVSDLTASSEPNRGHSDTGLQKAPEKKQEDWMCSECGGKNKHEDSCSQFAKQEQDRKTSKPTMQGAFKVLDVTQKTKSDTKAPYLVLEVLDTENRQGKLYCWHKSLHEHLNGAKDKMAILEVSEQKKGNSTYHQVEHILEIAGVSFVSDKPAEQGTLPSQEQEDF